MNCYRLRSDKLFNEDTGNYTTYGIDVFDSQSDMLLRSVSDISLEKSAVQLLVSQCNKLCLDIIHLDDVIEDFLGTVY